MKDIQIDLNDKQLVLQTKKFYLMQHFQYKMDSKKAKAKFISDKGVLELSLPILRSDDFWNWWPQFPYSLSIHKLSFKV